MTEYARKEEREVIDTARAYIHYILPGEHKYNEDEKGNLYQALEDAVIKLDTAEEGPKMTEQADPPPIVRTKVQSEVQDLSNIKSTLRVIDTASGEKICTKHSEEYLTTMCSVCVDVELRYCIQLEQRVGQLIDELAKRGTEITRLRNRNAELIAESLKSTQRG